VSYCIPPVSENFVRTSLQQLSASKATGLDDLSSYFLKTAASSISPSLTAIFNLSISSGVFPDLWKTAKVSPLHKDGSLFDRSNYRPISVLAVVSKILERHEHQTFYYFLSQHPNTSCCWIRNLVSVVLVRVSLLSPIFLITF